MAYFSHDMAGKLFAYSTNSGPVVYREIEDIYFIPNSESKAEKSHIVCSEKISYFFTSDEYDLYFFTVANRGCFDNLELNFFQKNSWNAPFLSDITLRMHACQIK